jgi:hypothetical protein
VHPRFKPAHQGPQENTFQFQTHGSSPTVSDFHCCEGSDGKRKAEETICLTFLKINVSLGMYQEIVVKGCNLFLAEVDIANNDQMYGV